jgi:hypothetical protein
MSQADTQEVAAPETPPVEETPPANEPSLADAIKASLEEDTPAPADDGGEAEPKPVDSEGTPVEAAPEGEAAPPEKAAEPAVEPPAKKDLLEELGPLPENASVKTKERFERLTTGYKEVVAERDQVRQDLERASYIADGWAEAVARCGANTDQIATMFRYLEGRNSPSPEGRRQAYETLKSELVTLAKELGEEAPGVDPLEAHPDLKAAVEDLRIDQEYAREVAKARAAQKLGQQHVTQQHAEIAAQAEARNAVGSIREYAAAKQAENPAEFAAKQKAVEAYAQRVMQKHPPAAWPQLIADYYETVPAAAAPVAAAPVARVPNPIRSTGVGAGKATGLSQEPKNTKEAIQLSLQQSMRT